MNVAVDAGGPPDPSSPDLRLGRRRQVHPHRADALREEAHLRRPAFERSSATRRNSARPATDIDYALLVDGLEAEREQGITIDVAYRYFATEKRSFIVADTPGHEQFTRNMATGASNADLAIVLVDARKGLLTQTHRHSIIVSLLGVRHVVLAVNKIDLVDYSESVFRQIEADYRKFAETLGFRSLIALPISARHGDNVSSLSARTPWYSGPHLLDYLEGVEVEEDRRSAPFRLPVQWVNRPHQDFRGFAGTIPSGRVARGDRVVAAGLGPREHGRQPPGRRPRGRGRRGGRRGHADADRRDRHRTGRRAVESGRPPRSRRSVHGAHLIWMSAEPMLPGRSYLLKIGGRTTPAAVTELKHRLDVNNFDKLAAKQLDLNEVGFCNIATTMPVAFDPYADNRDTGGFILIDRATNETAAAGMIAHGLRRATNVHRHGAYGRPRGARRAQAPEAGDPLVHRPLGRGQIDDRQSGRGQASRARRPHDAARRRQRSPRPQQGPGLHRRRPGREHPARRRGGEADDRRRAHRAVLVHLAVPGRTAARSRHRGAKASSSRSSSMRRSKRRSPAIRRACTSGRWPARSRTSPASTSRTKHPRRRS